MSNLITNTFKRPIALFLVIAFLFTNTDLGLAADKLSPPLRLKSEGFPQDSAFIYLNYMIGRALYLNLSNDGLKSDLTNLVKKMRKLTADPYKKRRIDFTGFEFEKLYRDKDAFYLPYKNPKTGRELLLRYSKEAAASADVMRFDLEENKPVYLDVIDASEAEEKADKLAWGEFGYDEMVSKASAHLRAFILNGMKTMRAKVASPAGLNIGSGSGRLSGYLSKKTGCAIVDVDKAPIGPFFTRPNEFLKADAELLPFPDSSQDFITSTFFLNYADKERAVREWQRILKEGGQAFLILHDPDSYLFRDEANNPDKRAIDEQIRDIVEVMEWLDMVYAAANGKATRQECLKAMPKTEYKNFMASFEGIKTWLDLDEDLAMTKANLNSIRKGAIQDRIVMKALLRMRCMWKTRGNLLKNEEEIREFFEDSGFTVGRIERLKDSRGREHAFGVVLTKEAQSYRKAVDINMGELEDDLTKWLSTGDNGVISWISGTEIVKARLSMSSYAVNEINVCLDRDWAAQHSVIEGKLKSAVGWPIPDQGIGYIMIDRYRFEDDSSEMTAIHVIQNTKAYRRLMPEEKRILDPWRREAVKRLAEWAASKGLGLYRAGVDAVISAHPSFAEGKRLKENMRHIKANYIDPFDPAEWEEVKLLLPHSLYFFYHRKKPFTWYKYKGPAAVSGPAPQDAAHAGSDLKITDEICDDFADEVCKTLNLSPSKVCDSWRRFYNRRYPVKIWLDSQKPFSPTSFIRIGRLFFLDESKYAELERSIKPQFRHILCSNLIKISPTESGDIFFRYTHWTILAIMLLIDNADRLASRRIIDAGAGGGVLSLVALKLGAASAELIDNNTKHLEKAEHDLRSNGFAGRYILHNIDLKDRERLRDVLTAKAEDSRGTVIITNIGGSWGYTASNIDGIGLAEFAPSTELIIGGGDYVESLKPIKAYLEERGFAIEPAMATYEYASKETPCAWLAINRGTLTKLASDLSPVAVPGNSPTSGYGISGSGKQDIRLSGKDTPEPPSMKAAKTGGNVSLWALSAERLIEMLQARRPGDIRWHGRTATIDLGDGRIAAFKFWKKEEDLSDLDNEANMMQELVAAGLDVPLIVKPESGNIVRCDIIPPGTPEVVNPYGACIIYITTPDYFRYPETTKSKRDLRLCAVNSIRQLAEMLIKGYAHTSISPLSHYGTRQWAWSVRPIGGIEDPDEKTKYSNIRLQGLADFAHVEKIRNFADLDFYTGQALSEWAIVIAYRSLKNGFTEGDTISILREGFKEYLRVFGVENPRFKTEPLERVITLLKKGIGEDRIYSGRDGGVPALDSLILLVEDILAATKASHRYNALYSLIAKRTGAIPEVNVPAGAKEIPEPPSMKAAKVEFQLTPKADFIPGSSQLLYTLLNLMKKQGIEVNVHTIKEKSAEDITALAISGPQGTAGVIKKGMKLVIVMSSDKHTEEELKPLAAKLQDIFILDKVTGHEGLSYEARPKAGEVYKQLDIVAGQPKAESKPPSMTAAPGEKFIKDICDKAEADESTIVDIDWERINDIFRHKGLPEYNPESRCTIHVIKDPGIKNLFGFPQAENSRSFESLVPFIFYKSAKDNRLHLFVTERFYKDFMLLDYMNSSYRQDNLRDLHLAQIIDRAFDSISPAYRGVNFTFGDHLISEHAGFFASKANISPYDRWVIDALSLTEKGRSKLKMFPVRSHPLLLNDEQRQYEAAVCAYAKVAQKRSVFSGWTQRFAYHIFNSYKHGDIEAFKGLCERARIDADEISAAIAETEKGHVSKMVADFGADISIISTTETVVDRDISKNIIRKRLKGTQYLRSLTLDNYKKAARRLGGLIADFIILGETIYQEQVTPLPEYLMNLLNSEGRFKVIRVDDVETKSRISKRIIENYFNCIMEMVRRGVIVTDVKIPNFGVRENGEIVLVDLGNITTAEDSPVIVKYNLAKFIKSLIYENTSRMERLGKEAGMYEGWVRLSVKIDEALAAKIREGWTDIWTGLTGGKRLNENKDLDKDGQKVSDIIKGLLPKSAQIAQSAYREATFIPSDEARNDILLLIMDRVHHSHFAGAKRHESEPPSMTAAPDEQPQPASLSAILPLLRKAVADKYQELSEKGDDRPIFLVIDGASKVGKTALSRYFLEGGRVGIIHLDDITGSHIYGYEPDDNKKPWDEWASAIVDMIREAHKGKKYDLIILEGFEMMRIAKIMSEKFNMPCDFKINVIADWKTRKANLRTSEEILAEDAAGYLAENTQSYPFAVNYDFIIDNSINVRPAINARFSILPEKKGKATGSIQTNPEPPSMKAARDRPDDKSRGAMSEEAGSSSVHEDILKLNGAEIKDNDGEVFTLNIRDEKKGPYPIFIEIRRRKDGSIIGSTQFKAGKNRQTGRYRLDMGLADIVDKNYQGRGIFPRILHLVSRAMPDNSELYISSLEESETLVGLANGMSWSKTRMGKICYRCGWKPDLISIYDRSDSEAKLGDPKLREATLIDRHNIMKEFYNPDLFRDILRRAIRDIKDTDQIKEATVSVSLSKIRRIRKVAPEPPSMTAAGDDAKLITELQYQLNLVPDQKITMAQVRLFEKIIRTADADVKAAIKEHLIKQLALETIGIQGNGIEEFTPQLYVSWNDEVFQPDDKDGTSYAMAQVVAKQIKPGEVVLDAGCGMGIQALSALSNGASFTVCIDNKPLALLLTLLNADKMGLLDKVQVDLVDIRRLEDWPSPYLYDRVIFNAPVPLPSHLIEDGRAGLVDDNFEDLDGMTTLGFLMGVSHLIKKDGVINLSSNDRIISMIKGLGFVIKDTVKRQKVLVIYTLALPKAAPNDTPTQIRDAMPARPEVSRLSPIGQSSEDLLNVNPIRRYLAEMYNDRDAIDKFMGILRTKNRVVLEFGCGAGNTAYELARRNPALGVLSTDLFSPSNPMFDLYTHQFETRKLMGQTIPRENLVVARSGISIIDSLTDGSIDYILLNAPELQVVKEVIEKIRTGSLLKKLKAGGCIFVQPHSKKSYDETIGLYLSLGVEINLLSEPVIEGVNLKETSDFASDESIPMIRISTTPLLSVATTNLNPEPPSMTAAGDAATPKTNEYYYELLRKAYYIGSLESADVLELTIMIEKIVGLYKDTTHFHTDKDPIFAITWRKNIITLDELVGIIVNDLPENSGKEKDKKIARIKELAVLLKDALDKFFLRYLKAQIKFDLTRELAGSKKGDKDRLKRKLKEISAQSARELVNGGDYEKLKRSVAEKTGLSISAVDSILRHYQRIVNPMWIESPEPPSMKAAAAQASLSAILPLIRKAVADKYQELSEKGDDRPIFLVIDGASKVGKTALSRCFLEGGRVGIIHLDDITGSHIYGYEPDDTKKPWGEWASAIADMIREALNRKKYDLIILEGFEMMRIAKIMSEKFNIPCDFKVNVIADKKTRESNLRATGDISAENAEEYLTENTQHYPFAVAYDFVIDNSIDVRPQIDARFSILPEKKVRAKVKGDGQKGAAPQDDSPAGTKAKPEPPSMTAARDKLYGKVSNAVPISAREGLPKLMELIVAKLAEREKESWKRPVTLWIRGASGVGKTQIINVIKKARKMAGLKISVSDEKDVVISLESSAEERYEARTSFTFPKDAALDLAILESINLIPKSGEPVDIFARVVTDERTRVSNLTEREKNKNAVNLFLKHTEWLDGLRRQHIIIENSFGNRMGPSAANRLLRKFMKELSHKIAKVPTSGAVPKAISGVSPAKKEGTGPGSVLGTPQKTLKTPEPPSMKALSEEMLASLNPDEKNALTAIVNMARRFGFGRIYLSNAEYTMAVPSAQLFSYERKELAVFIGMRLVRDIALFCSIIKNESLRDLLIKSILNHEVGHLLPLNENYSDYGHERLAELMCLDEDELALRIWYDMSRLPISGPRSNESLTAEIRDWLSRSLGPDSINEKTISDIARRMAWYDRTYSSELSKIAARRMAIFAENVEPHKFMQITGVEPLTGVVVDKMIAAVENRRAHAENLANRAKEMVFSEGRDETSKETSIAVPQGDTLGGQKTKPEPPSMTAAGDEKVIKIPVYMDRKGIMHIRWNGIPESRTKRLLSLMRKRRYAGELWLFGGTPRNLLLGISPKDFDFIAMEENHYALPQIVLGDLLNRTDDGYVFEGFPVSCGTREELTTVPSFTSDRLIMGFDGENEDPFIRDLDDRDSGYDDIFHRKAKLAHGFQLPFSTKPWRFTKILRVLIDNNLTPTNDTDGDLADAANEFIQKFSKTPPNELHEKDRELIATAKEYLEIRKEFFKTPDAKREPETPSMTAASDRVAMLKDAVTKAALKAEADETGKKHILLAVETGAWLGTERSKVESYLGTIRNNIARKVNRIPGLENVEVDIVHGATDKFAGNINAKRNEFKVPNRNIVVAGSEETLRLGAFDELRGSAFMASMDFVNAESIFELLELEVKLAFGLRDLEDAKSEHPDIEITHISDREFRLKAKPIDINVLHQYRKWLTDLETNA